MLLAQIAEATKAAEKAIADSAQFGFAAYFLMVFFFVTVGVYLLNWWFVAHPAAKSQRDCNEKIAQAVQSFAVTDAAKTQIMGQMTIWQQTHDSRLTAIDRSITDSRCMLPASCPTQPHPV